MRVSEKGKFLIWYGSGGILCISAFLFLLFYGPVNVPFKSAIMILLGGEGEKVYWSTIIIHSRLPMAISATACGATLSAAGLMMQTFFHNPLAGPSVLGISSGASLGVAVIILGTGMSGFSLAGASLLLSGAIIGAAMTILILIVFSTMLRNGVMLLIVGIMLSYLCSSAISLLNYFSPADEIRSYLFWGLGSFSIQLDNSILLLSLSLILLALSLFFMKPLNALLVGERFAESVGYSSKSIRNLILTITGLLVAIPTSFCGPIGFIGLVAPHLCRLLLGTSNHFTLLPGSILFGATLSLICADISIIPASRIGVLPINTITPLIGVPVILYLLVKRKKIFYFQ